MRHATRRPFAFVNPDEISKFPNMRSKRRPGDTMTNKMIARFTIHRAAAMTPQGRHEIAEWLRQQAQLVENEGAALSPTFTARYFAR